MMNQRIVQSALTCFALVFVAIPSWLHAQERTVGVLLNTDEAYEGYTLFSGLQGKTTYLIDMDGRIVHSWQSDYTPGNMVYLLENGHLLHTGAVGGRDGDFGVTGGSGGIIQEYDWDGNLLWEYRYANDSVRQHHDAIMLPSGNVVLIAWELVTYDEAIASGRDPSTLPEDGLWVDHLVEVKPVGSDDGEIVWEWHAMDHLVQDYDASKENYGVVADHPELIDFNAVYSQRASEDWMHCNALAYNEELDQIVVSSPGLNEVFIVDHSTTTAEAADHAGGAMERGGDLLYRWGNPRGYDAGSANDRQLFFQHNVHWIPEGLPGEGNLLIFNNGQGRRDGQYSSVVEIVPPLQDDGSYTYTSGEAYGPSEPVWTYVAPTPTDFYSGSISSAQRMPNGNTLVCAGEDGWFFEITSDGEIVWEYISPITRNGILDQGDQVTQGNPVFRVLRYSPDYAAFTGRDLTPGDFIEGYTSGVSREGHDVSTSIAIRPNPAHDNATLSVTLADPSVVTLSVSNSRGEIVRIPLQDEVLPAGEHQFEIALSSLPAGRYWCRLVVDGTVLGHTTFMHQ